MNAVLYYSATGRSKWIAAYLAEQTGFALSDIRAETERVFENAVLVFPVHCQNIPDAVAAFADELTAHNLTVVATYGRMWHGNVLHELQKLNPNPIVAAAYVPTAHTYLPDDAAFARWDELAPLVAKIANPAPIVIPPSYKNPFSDLCKGLRSRAGVKLYRDGRCDGCGVCTAECPRGAIENGKPNGMCIRCLHCVAVCPQRALHAVNRLPMRLYLRKRKIDDLILYL